MTESREIAPDETRDGEVARARTDAVVERAAPAFDAEKREAYGGRAGSRSGRRARRRVRRGGRPDDRRAGSR